MAKMVKKAEVKTAAPNELTDKQMAVLRALKGKAAAKGWKADQIAAKAFPGSAGGTAIVRHSLEGLLERKVVKRVSRGLYAAA